MSYSIIIGGELEFPLASIGGWRNLKKWAADNLNTDEHDKILHFIEYSWVQDLGEFESQIADVVESAACIPEDVESTFTDMLVSIGRRKRSHTLAIITDGMSRRIDGDATWEVKDDEPAAMLSKAADFGSWEEDYP